MESNQRMSLADFQVTKFENQSEIENLLGGLAAATCHVTFTDLTTPGFPGSWIGKDSDDCA